MDCLGLGLTKGLQGFMASLMGSKIQEELRKPVVVDTDEAPFDVAWIVRNTKSFDTKVCSGRFEAPEAFTEEEVGEFKEIFMKVPEGQFTKALRSNLIKHLDRYIRSEMLQFTKVSVEGDGLAKVNRVLEVGELIVFESEKGWQSAIVKNCRSVDDEVEYSVKFYEVGGDVCKRMHCHSSNLYFPHSKLSGLIRMIGDGGYAKKIKSLT